MITGLRMVVLRVKDLAETQRFFEQGLGLVPERSMPGVATQFLLPNGPVLEIIQSREAVDMPTVIQREQAPEAIVFAVDDISRMVERAVLHGGRLVAAPFELAGRKVAYLAGPEGHIVGMSEPL
ncbi:MAG: VOC family protein [Dehalococcoidia bacterium]|nr:VOC family protein [Dehalococcoidia bacterium]